MARSRGLAQRRIAAGLRIGFRPRRRSQVRSAAKGTENFEDLVRGGAGGAFGANRGTRPIRALMPSFLIDRDFDLVEPTCEAQSEPNRTGLSSPHCPGSFL
jgi:hypothetical protein